MSAARVLTVSWEYPPVVEGGLARHVRKLSERLVAQASEHVLRFDWADVARQTRAVYDELRGATAPSTTS